VAGRWFLRNRSREIWLVGLDIRMTVAAGVVLDDSGEWENVERRSVVEAVRRLRTLKRDHAVPPGKWVVLNRLALGSTEFAVDTSIAECVQGSFVREILNAGEGAAACKERRQILKMVSLRGEVVGM